MDGADDIVGAGIDVPAAGAVVEPSAPFTVALFACSSGSVLFI